MMLTLEQASVHVLTDVYPGDMSEAPSGLTRVAGCGLQGWSHSPSRTNLPAYIMNKNKCIHLLPERSVNKCTAHQGSVALLHCSTPEAVGPSVYY